jgi:hypothetical protein
MANFGRTVFGVLCLFLVTQAPLANGQSTLPDIDLTCSPAQVMIQVFPGSTGTGITTCTISNNSAYTLDVDIEVTSSDLAHQSPGSIRVGPSSTADFQLTLKSEFGALMSQKSVNVEATVTSVNDLPPITEEKSEANLIAYIMQYSGVEITASQPLIKISSGETKELIYTVKNTGNAMDFFLFRIPFDNIDILEDAGFIFVFDSVRMQIDEGQTEQVKVSITAPYKENSREDLIFWKGKSNGDNELTIQLGVTATSDFSCRNAGCYSRSVLTTITVTDKSTDSFFSDSSNLIYIGIGSVSAILITALIVFMLKNKSQKELTNPPIKSANPIIKNKVKPVSSIKQLPPKDEFDFL